MATAKAQGAQVLLAREATPGTAPSSGWRQMPPNPGGIQGFHAEYIDVAPNRISPNMTRDKGDHVGLNVNPTLVYDLTKTWLDIFGPGLLRSVPKVPGNKGVQAYYPTAVTATGYTVAASGDLTNKLLVFARGFTLPANNGVKVLAGTSTTLEVKATGLAAETVVQGTAMLEVCGVEAGAATEISMNASGHLVASGTTTFTALGLLPGHKVFFRIGAGANEFGTLTPPVGQDGAIRYLNWATVVAVTSTLITLKEHSFTPGADAATGKTIRLYFGVLYRNVPDGDPDYIEEPSYAAELRDTGVGAAGAPVFSVAEGLVPNRISFAMGVESKVEVTTAFMARKISAPLEAANRIAGPSSAYPAISMELFDTSSNDMILHRVYDAATGSVLTQAVNSATLTIEHGVTARKQLASFGPHSMVFGNIAPMVEMETFYEDATIPRAIADNRDCRYEALWKNGQAAVAIDLPTITLRNGSKTYAENSPVMMALGAPAHRDATTNVVMRFNVLPYLP